MKRTGSNETLISLIQDGRHSKPTLADARMATTAEDLQKLNCNLVLQKLSDPQLKCHDRTMSCFLTFGRRAAGDMHSIKERKRWSLLKQKKKQKGRVAAFEFFSRECFDRNVWFSFNVIKNEKEHKTENYQMTHKYKRVTQRTIAKISLLLKVSTKLPKTTFMKQQLKLPAGQKCRLSKSMSLENGMLGNLPEMSAFVGGTN